MKCAQCDASYIGETERALRIRVQEHHRKTSAVGLHMAEKGHTFSDEDNVKILHTESRTFHRKVAEAIYIGTNNPSLNRDRGRTLPPIYRGILQSCDHTHHRGHVTRVPQGICH